MMKQTIIKPIVMMLVGLMMTAPTYALRGNGIENIFHQITGGTLEYYVTFTDGTLSDQLTTGSRAEAGSTVYVKATPDLGNTVKNMTIEAVESYASTGAEAPAFRAPGVGTGVTLTKVSNSNGLYSFTMPANGNDVTITALLPAKATNTAAISYIDFDGVTQTANVGTVYILDGTEEVLGSREYDPDTSQPYVTWYVCNTPATENDGKGLCYNSKLTTEGRVNLILADGCKMTVNASESNSGALHANDLLTIWGQTNGTGALDVSSENANGIHASSLGIAGGHVTAHSTNKDGIHCGGEISIYDGVVSASSDTKDGIGIYAENGSVSILGGQVTATGGTNGVGIRLFGDDRYVAFGWRKPTDFIEVSSYDLLSSSNRIYIEDNLVMQYSDDAGIHKILGGISKNNNGTPEDPVDDFYPIAGKKLTPYGYGGYCGSDDLSTDEVDESKNLMWEIPLVDADNDTSTPMTLSTTMTVEGKGSMTYNGETAPWNNNEKYPYSSINVKATSFLSLQSITSGTPVALHFLGDIPSDCQERYVVTTNYGGDNEPVELTLSNGVYTFQVPASGSANIDPAIAIGFADGETWRTWCDHNTWSLPAGIEAYTISSMSATGQITLTSVNEPDPDPYASPKPKTIPACTPLLLQKTGDDLVAIYDSDAASNSLVSSVITDVDDNTVATLWGNPTNTAITEGDFTESGLTAYNFYRGAFVRVENSQEVGAHHCLLTTSSTIAPQSLAISGLTGGSNQFGHITYTGTAANDGGALKFFTSSKDAEQGQNEITVTNGQSTGPTDLDGISIWNGNESEFVGTGFFIMATPAVGHRLPKPAADGTVSFIQAEVVTQAQQAPGLRAPNASTIEVGQKLDVKFYGYYTGYSLGNDPATEYYGLYYVVMPADVNLSISITATFPGVATNTEAISYVAADGETLSKAAGTVYVLDGTEARLGYGSYNNRTEHETWYVLPDDLTYTNGLELYGKVHLILADGKTMTYDGTESFISGYGNLDIYGQGGTTEGAINAKNTSSSCIFSAGDVTINGGNISAESTATISSDGIQVEKTLTINRGTVSGKGNDVGIFCYTVIIHDGNVSGIGTATVGIGAGYTSTLTITGGHVSGEGGKYGLNCGGGIVITGGQIEATGGTGENRGGIYSEAGDIILGWTNPTDYIKANSYKCQNLETSGKVVKTATGKRLVAYSMADESDISASTIVSGTVDDVTTLAGKTLKPLASPVVSISGEGFSFDKDADFVIADIPYYIYDADAQVTCTYEGSGIVQVTGLPEGTAPVENQPMQRQFTMPAADVALTATAVTGLTAIPVIYDGAAQTPVIMQGDNVFDATNYAIAYKLGDEVVTAAEVKNVNTYTCVLTGLGQYVGTTTVPFTINKADFYQPIDIPDITKYVPQDKSGSYTIALPALPEGAAYTFTKTDADGIIDNYSYDDEHNMLTYTTNSGKTGGTTATITVTAAGAPNYNDYSFAVNVTVSEYTTAYAWPEQTSIWLDADNELVWAEGGITLDGSLLTVTKGGTAVTDFTAKVGETTLTTADNTLALEPGAHSINITGDDGKLDDWVEFKVIKLVEDDNVFNVKVDDSTWGLDGGNSGNAVDTPPTNHATLLCNGQELEYSTDTDLDEFLNAHSGLKLWFENNDDMPDSNPVNRVFTLNSLADGEVCNVFGRRESWEFNGLGSIEAIGGNDQLVFLPGNMSFKQLTDDDGEPVSASSKGGYIYYLSNNRPNLHYVETEENGETKWALYNGDEKVPENQYFLDGSEVGSNVYYGNGNAYTTYNAGSTGEFISFHPINFVINSSPVDWNPDGVTLDPDHDYAFYMYICGAPRYFSTWNDHYILVGKDFVFFNNLIYTGDVVPEVVDGNKIKIGDFTRSADPDSSHPTPVVWMKNATIADLVTKERKWPHANARYKVDDYNYQIASCDFIIFPNNSNAVIMNELSAYKVDEDITFTVDLYGPKKGGANVFLNGEWMQRLEGTGTHEVTLPGQYEGSYRIDVYGDCDKYVTSFNTTTSINVFKLDPLLTLTGKQNTAGEEFETGANIEYHPENPIVVNAITGYYVSNTNWKWTISDQNVITQDHIVNESGNDALNSEDIYLNTVGLGEVTLSARFSGNDSYNRVTKTMTFTVVPMQVATPIIELVDQSAIYYYDGTPKTPAVKVYYAAGKEIPTDQYTVSYENNTDASSNAKIIVKSVTGALYTIDAVKEFEIRKAEVTITKLPIAEAIADGERLMNSHLTEGWAKAGGMDVYGGFNWVDESIVPTIDDSNVTEYDVIFTPFDRNFASGSCKVTVKVVAAATLFAANSTNLWATFCDSYERIVPGGCTAYTISSIDGSTVNLSAVTPIPAYTPVLVRREAGELNEDIKATYNDEEREEPDNYTGIVTATGTDWTFYGNATDTHMTEGYSYAYGQSYGLYNGEFVLIGTDEGIAAHRCLLNVSNGQSAPVLTISETTKVETTNLTNFTNSDTWFTIDGRKLQSKPTKKGLYIHNGKKTLIK